MSDTKAGFKMIADFHAARTGRHPRAQGGFTLIEALVALVVVSFGMMAIAGFQLTMTRNSDIAKQRSEAVRLAQKEMERLRTFETVISDGTKIDYVELLGGTKTVDAAQLVPNYLLTNTSYTVAWAVTRFDGTTATSTNSATDPEKWINVSVTWTDRANSTQVVRLRSVISKADPIDLGTLATGPGGTKTRTPKNRNVNIPYPAVDLGGGLSGFQPPGITNLFYVFNNVSGDVVTKCTGALASYASLANTSDCITLNGYLLSGYIRFLYTNLSGNEAAQDAAVSQAQGNLLNLTANMALAGSSTVPACYVQRQKVVRYSNPPSSTVTGSSIPVSGTMRLNTGNNGFSVGQSVIVSGTLNGVFDGIRVVTGQAGGGSGYVEFAFAGTGSTSIGKVSLLQDIVLDESTPLTGPYASYSLVDKYVAYTCVIEHYTRSISSVNVEKSWWGRFYVTPVLTLPATTTWGMASSGSNANSCDTTPEAGCNYKLCRFSGDYISDDQISNSEHPLDYRAANFTLDNQNYLFVNSNANCPTNGEINISSANYLNTNTIVHQSASDGTAAGATGGARSTGSQWTTAGEEPADTSATIPMF